MKQEVYQESQENRFPETLLEPATRPGTPLATRFADEMAAIGGTVYRLPEKDVKLKLAKLLRERGIKRVAVDDVGEKYISEVESVRVPEPTVWAGVTGALLGIAESGSLVLVGGEGRPLTASLLPEIHIAILRESEIVPTLLEALRRPEIRSASAGVIITGPSRTGDIEMTLSIGVHGPKELHVFLIE
jgi:L-lactate dehydrogenase complex protein LldG